MALDIIHDCSAVLMIHGAVLDFQFALSLIGACKLLRTLN